MPPRAAPLTSTLGVTVKNPHSPRSTKGYQSDQVLRYSSKPASRSTVRRHYAQWRLKQRMPVRCDMTDCVFHTQPLIWLGKPLPLILDHINGNNLDNSPQNLRYVCPNCDAQFSTRGGGNRGRVQEAGDGKYVLMSRDGKRHYHLIAETGHYHLTGHAPAVTVTPSGSGK